MNAQTISRQWRMLGALLMSIVFLFGGTGAVTAQDVLGPHDHVRVCHATPAHAHPYVSVSPNVDGIFGADTPANAHDEHLDDIIPPFRYDLGDGAGTKVYPGMNWTAENQAIWENDCMVPGDPELIVTSPGEVTFTQATCETKPTLTLPTDGNGVSYSYEGTVAAGETIIVTATINPDTHVWGNVPAPWIPVDAATATQQIIFAAEPDCRTSAIPGELVITQATCEEPAGLAVQDNGEVTYVVEGTVAAGETVTVTAGIDPTLHVWGTPIDPWVLVDEATLTQEVVFTVPDCPTPTTPPIETPTETPVTTPTTPPVATPSETPEVIPTETQTVPPTKTTENAPSAVRSVTPPNVESVTDMPVTGSGTEQRGNLIISVAGVAALGIIAFGLRRYSDV